MVEHPDIKRAALACLTGDEPKTRKAGSFLGQCAVDPTPLSAAQAEWFDKLMVRANLAPLFGSEEA